LGSTILVFAELPRAMDYLREGLQSGRFQHGTLVFARRLTQAKGRFSRSWLAPRGGLWLALALYDDLLPEIHPWLPVCLGLAVTRALRKFGAAVWLRWVNDVHVQGRKVAGLLLEESFVQGERWILVGIGVNVNNALPEHLLASSLASLLGRRCSLAALFGQLCGELIHFYGLLRTYEAAYLAEEAVENPLRRWFLTLSDTLGQKVLFGEDLEAGPAEVAWAEGIDSRARLVLRTAEGSLTLRSGEVRYL